MEGRVCKKNISEVDFGAEEHGILPNVANMIVLSVLSSREFNCIKRLLLNRVVLERVRSDFGVLVNRMLI